MRDPQKDKTFIQSLPETFSLLLFVYDFTLRTVYAYDTLLYKKNRAHKWNIRVVESGGRWIARYETWILTSPCIRTDSRFFLPF